MVATILEAELGEADSTFIFAARLRSMAQGCHPWPPARRKEAVKNPMQDTFFFWGACGMMAEDEETCGKVWYWYISIYLKDV